MKSALKNKESALYSTTVPRNLLNIGRNSDNALNLI